MVFKKRDKFAVLLSNISSNLKEAAHYFDDFKLENISDLKIFSERMKKYETDGDSLVHSVIRELNHAFITPIEREDILDLTIRMDDVLDGLEECSALLEMYSITTIDDFMRKFSAAICKSTIEIEKSVEMLSTKKLLPIREHVIQIKDYEAQCDGILRQSIKHLFSVEKDPIRIIQYKEIYENLEDVADCCQAVANTLESIIMKNA